MGVPQLKSYKPNADVIEFIYNAEGTRTQKTVTPYGEQPVSTYYQYDANGNIVLETYKDEQQQIQIKAKYIRDNEGKALSIELPTPDSGLRTYYYLYNAHGDVTGLTDSSGNVVATYIYDEFGNLINSTGSIYNPLRYSGANNSYFDEETNLYKMGARYYDSSTGRWITKDSYKGEQEEPQSKNLYVYTNNEPINSYDESGNWPDRDHKTMTYRVAHWGLQAVYRPDEKLNRGRTWFTDRNSIRMAQENYDFDTISSAITHPLYHFSRRRIDGHPIRAWQSIHPWDYPAFRRDPRVKHALERLDSAVKTVKYKRKYYRTNDDKWRTAATDIGAALHSIQDIYSHMDYTPIQHLWMRRYIDNKKATVNGKSWKRWRYLKTYRATHWFLHRFSKMINS